MDSIFAIVIPVVIVVVIVIAVLAEKKKRERLEAYAAEKGWSYYPSGSPMQADAPGCLSKLGASSNEAILSRYQGFSPFGIGHRQLVRHVLTSQQDGEEWIFFDYQYTTGTGKNKTTHRYFIGSVFVPLRLEEMEVGQESFLHRAGGLVGIKDIQFESEEFNRKFWVKAGRDEFAYHVLHPTMMEHFLQHSMGSFQMNGPALVVHSYGSLNVKHAEQLHLFLDGLLERLPDYLKEDLSHR
jgi:hypothetical protein